MRQGEGRMRHNERQAQTSICEDGWDTIRDKLNSQLMRQNEGTIGHNERPANKPCSNEAGQMSLKPMTDQLNPALVLE